MMDLMYCAISQTDWLAWSLALSMHLVWHLIMKRKSRVENLHLKSERKNQKKVLIQITFQQDKINLQEKYQQKAKPTNLKTCKMLLQRLEEKAVMTKLTTMLSQLQEEENPTRQKMSIV